MHAKTVLRRLLGITTLFVQEFEVVPDGLVVFVRPTSKAPRCGACGNRAPGFDRGSPRRWRHLGLGRLRIWLMYTPRRVECATCGVRVEAVPWAAHDCGFTRDFEELVAYLAQTTDKTAVTKLMGIAWATVGRIIERVVKGRLDPDRLRNLKRIGVDEFSYRRRHKYLTVVVDHDRKRIVWAGPGARADTLVSFFESLGAAQCAEIEVATIDMSAGYKKAIREHLPNAKVVFDRFHVQRLASDALDAVRREELRELRGSPEGRDLFKSRFVLLKNPWNLNSMERLKLRDIEKSNAKLYRAYTLKETLAKALEYKQPWRARQALVDWLGWASRSKLKPFVRTARTIRKHLEGVLAYVEERLTNGIVEGLNTRLRMIARRSFGFHGPEPLIALLYLCCGGIMLDPPLPGPTDV